MIHVYTGNGKGKTSAALGLAIRAAGAGLKVYIIQFVKGRYYHELKSLAKIKNIKVEQFGRPSFIKNKPCKADIELAQRGLKMVKLIFQTKKCDVLILDEVNVAIKLKLLELKEVCEVIKNKPASMELICTGRFACPEIIKMADLVSEIKEVKHYFHKGCKARKGIEF